MDGEGQPARTDAGQPGLARRLGLATASAMVVGEVIGVGIFLTPAGMARTLGSAGWLIGVWLVMGASALGGALAFGGLAARYPEAGGIYVYLREAYGPRIGFLYGWVSMLVTDPGLTAFLGAGMATYVAHLHLMPLSGWGLKAAAVGAIVAMAAVNMLGLSIGSGVLRVLAGLKIGMLAFLAVWGFVSGRGDLSNLEPFWSQRPGAEAPLPAIAGGLIGAFISLAGWWDASRLSGEVRDPERTMPRALLLGLSIVTALYIGVSLAFLYLVSPASLSANPKDEAFAAMAGQALFGRRGEVAFAAVVVISVVGSLAAVLMAFPRVYYAMARDGLFFAGFAAVDPSRGAPVRATAVQAVLGSALVLVLDSPGRIIGYFMVPTLAFLVPAVAAVFVLRRRSARRGEPGIAVPGYPVAPLAFLIPVTIVIVLQAAREPWTAAFGAGLVAAGLPASLLVPALRRRVNSGQNQSSEPGSKIPGEA